ncbi:MAG: sigma-70 family RNA polymerase sigma factor [Deltaproteobacteria bacterium]|nr:sigma-70 family RNA polymerase sigma factor [Deltaproteobacteria bacterium]
MMAANRVKSPRAIEASSREGLRVVTEVVHEMARRLRYRIDPTDLESLGVMVLCDAMTRYDPRRCDFAPYVSERLRWAMMSEARREQRRHRLLAEACGVSGDDTEEEVDGDDVAMLFGPSSTDDPASALEQRELRQHLRRSLRALPDEVRAVLIRHYFGGESFEEVARETSRSKATVTRLHHAGLTMLGASLGWCAT